MQYKYELAKCKNTGNWWIWRIEPDGFRDLVRVLRHELSLEEANQRMKAYIEEINNG